MMLLNRIPALNLPYALGEIALIFIGVTAAFVFEQFKDERSMRVEERAILLEIVEDLRATRIDLLSDIERSGQRLAKQLEVMRAVQANDPAELARTDLPGIAGGAQLYAKIGGYRALQNAGLGLVSDRRLRISLTDFYELRVPRIRDREDNADKQTGRLVDILVKHLTVHWSLPSTDSIHNGVPNPGANSIALRDAKALLSEQELSIVLQIVYSLTNTTLLNYEEALLEVENLIEDIERHLEVIS